MTDRASRTADPPGRPQPTRAIDDPLMLGRAARLVRLALARQTGRPDDHHSAKAETPTLDNRP